MDNREHSLSIVLESNIDLLSHDFYGCTCGEGWAALLDQILRDWRASGAPPIRRIKEKLGSLRITAVDRSHPEARRLSLLAMERSEQICEICGELGKQMAMSGLRATRCSQHRL